MKVLSVQEWANQHCYLIPCASAVPEGACQRSVIEAMQDKDVLGVALVGAPARRALINIAQKVAKVRIKS